MPSLPVILQSPTSPLTEEFLLRMPYFNFLKFFTAVELFSSQNISEVIFVFCKKIMKTSETSENMFEGCCLNKNN